MERYVILILVRYAFAKWEIRKGMAKPGMRRSGYGLQFLLGLS